MPRINLADTVGPDVRVLIGQDRGVAVRAAMHLDELDNSQTSVEFVIPETLRTLTPSFVQGFFSNSVHRLGESGFFAHYKFDARPHIVSDIHAGIDRILTSRHLAGVD